MSHKFLKKSSSLLILLFTFTASSLAAQSSLPVEERTEKSGPDMIPSTYAIAPITPKPIQPQQSQIQKDKKLAAVVLATAATIAIGLIASSADTGQKVHQSSSN